MIKPIHLEKELHNPFIYDMAFLLTNSSPEFDAGISRFCPSPGERGI